MKATLIKKIFSLNNTTYFLIWLIALVLSITINLIYTTNNDNRFMLSIYLLIGFFVALILVTLPLRIMAYGIINLYKSNTVINSFYFHSCISLLFLLAIYIKSLMEIIITQMPVVEMCGASLFLFPVYVGLYLPLKEAKKD